MSILRRRHSQPEARGMFFGPGGQPLMPSSYYRGSQLEQALLNAASWACIDVIADPLGRTPIDAYRGRAVSRPVVPPPMILERPSAIVLSDVWRYQLGFSLATDGNAFGLITSYTGAAWPATIEWLDPAGVTQRKVVDNRPQVTLNDQTIHRLYPDGDVWHVPGRVIPPGTPFGLSPVEYATKQIGVSLLAEDVAYQFMNNGGQLRAIVKSKTNLTESQAQPIKQAILNVLQRGNSDFLVLGADLDWQTIQSTQAESQGIDLMRFQVEQMSRVWRVPPSMIYGAISGQNVTYSSVTDADLSLMKHTLDGYYTRIEKALTELLPRPQYVKVNRNAILRGDVKARYDSYAVALQNKWMTVNEVRALEEQPPFPGAEFDKPGVPPGPTPPALLVPPAAKPALAPAGNGNGSAK